MGLYCGRLTLLHIMVTYIKWELAYCAADDKKKIPQTDCEVTTEHHRYTERPSGIIMIILQQSVMI